MRKVLYIMGQLNDEDVEWMAQAGRRIAPQAGQALIRQGVPVADMFILLDGSVSVQVGGVTVAHLGSGELFGEMSFVDSAPPSATVSAETGCLALALDKRTIESRLADQPAFAGRFYKALAIFLADRLRSQNERVSASAGGGLKRDEIMEDELDDAVMDQVSVAGLRFERMIKTLMTARTA